MAPNSPGQKPSAESGEWPRITIVTPSFNQGNYIEATIESVLAQDYPNLEYIIMDAGSTDQTVEIIRKYEASITHWQSKKDRGQSHAINMAFEMATGEILGWINSDDMYPLNALRTVGRTFRETGCEVVSGNTVYIDSEGGRLESKPPVEMTLDQWLTRYMCATPQPSTFWSKACWEEFGPLEEDLHYRMDYPYFLCLKAAGKQWEIVADDLALFRRHEEQKTWSWGDPRFHAEKRHALEVFASHRDFGTRFASEIDRALNYEGWLVSWMATEEIGSSGMGGAFKMLKAPFCNPRCLTMGNYYRKFAGNWSRVLRQRFTRQAAV